MGRSINAGYSLLAAVAGVALLVGVFVLLTPRQPLSAQSGPEFFLHDDPQLTGQAARDVKLVKRWMEQQVMGGCTLEARFRVETAENGHFVHVLLVTGYRPDGSPIFVPQGHCLFHVGDDESISPMTRPWTYNERGIDVRETKLTPRRAGCELDRAQMAPSE